MNENQEQPEEDLDSSGIRPELFTSKKNSNNNTLAASRANIGLRGAI